MRTSGATARHLAALAGLLAACSDQVFEPIRDGLVSSAYIDGHVRVTTKADILFVVDDSASMDNEQVKLAAGFGRMVDALEALDPPVDYRVAVMTTSVDERFGPCDSADSDAPGICSAAFGGSGFVCEDNACFRSFPDRAGRLRAAPGNPTVLDRSQLPSEEIRRLFRQNIRVGLDGSRHEQPLRALRMAFANGSLDGFWRPDARLVVVIASDEDDCSDSRGRILAMEQTGSGFVDHCEEEARTDGPNLDSLSAWVRDFQSLPVPGGTREVALGVITGLDPGSRQAGMCTDEECVTECNGPAVQSACETQCQGSLRESRCRSECVGMCEQFCGSQVPGWRLVRLAGLAGGQVSSICESDYGPALAGLAGVMGIPEQVELPSKPSDVRAFFFRVQRNGRTIECEEGRDYRLELEDDPPVMVIEPGGSCRLLPDDRWRVRYVAE